MPANIRTVTLFIFVCFLLLIAGLFFLVLINSSGKPKPFLDENDNIIPNSISEKRYLELNGAEFGLFIKGKDKNNPVLLMLHGGMPFYFITQKYPTGLEELFTVVWWDQRGAGLSYNSKYNYQDITVDDLIEDTKEFTNYLRERFSQEKIYLMGHSGGTYLGIKTIEQYPELFTAYIGISQITNQKLSEQKAHQYILEQYENDQSKRKYARQLRENLIELSEPIPDAYYEIRDYAMHDLGVGTMRNMNSVVTGLFIPSLLFREYTLGEKFNLWRAKINSGVSVIWDEVISHDLSKESTQFKIPVYFLHGIYDYTVNYELAYDYFSKIKAPEKGFYTLKESAHSPIFEEPGKCLKIISEEILKK